MLCKVSPSGFLSPAVGVADPNLKEKLPFSGSFQLSEQTSDQEKNLLVTLPLQLALQKQHSLKTKERQEVIISEVKVASLQIRML